MRRSERGFTLIEVIVALGLSMMVLVGVLMVTTGALRAHYEQVRSGQDSTAEMYGIDNMVRTFENTTHLEPHYPDDAATPLGNHTEVRGCVDYSEAMAGGGHSIQGVIDGFMTGNWSNVMWYDFCWSPPGGLGPSGYATLFYDYGYGDCPVGALWPSNGRACGAFALGVGAIQPDAVAVNFYPIGYPASQTIFTRNWSGGIDMTFMVGIATSDYSGTGVSAQYKTVAMPVIYRMSTGSGTEKNYNAPLCGGLPCD